MIEVVLEWVDLFSDLKNIKSDVGLRDRLKLWWRYRPI
jgi:hypothetical protein